jgi:hypothetical protein
MQRGSGVMLNTGIERVDSMKTTGPSPVHAAVTAMAAFVDSSAHHSQDGLMHFLFQFLVQVLIIDNSLALALGLVATLCLRILELCVLLISDLDHLRVRATRAYNLTFFHPRVIATAAPAAEPGALVTLAILIIAYRFPGLACVSAGIADWGDNEPLAGY